MRAYRVHITAIAILALLVIGIGEFVERSGLRGRAVEVESFIEYTHERSGIVISYPANWHLGTDAGSIVLACAPTEQGSSLLCRLEVSSPSFLEGFSTTEIAVLLETYTWYDRQLSFEATVVDRRLAELSGYRAVQYSLITQFPLPDPPVVFKEVRLVTGKNGDLIELVCQAEESEFASYAPTFRAIVSELIIPQS